MRSHKAFMDITINGEPVGRIEIKLYDKTHPKTVENFKALCKGVVLKKAGDKKKEGEEGWDDLVEGKEYGYKGCRFHRVIQDFMAQSGDITHGMVDSGNNTKGKAESGENVKPAGSGGYSIHGRTFEDENLKNPNQLHKQRGLVSMANAGPNTNSSQFFFLFSPQKHLDGRHVVFGEIDEGLEDVLAAIEGKEKDEDGNW